MSTKRWQPGQTKFKSVWNSLKYGVFFACRAVVLSFILKKSTDYRQIAHDHACQIQLENQQPRYLARTINSGNFVHSCKYDFRKYWGSKRKRTNPMISRSRYLQPWSISKWAHDQILLHRKWWDSNVPTKRAREFSQLQNLLIGTHRVQVGTYCAHKKCGANRSSCSWDWSSSY